MAMPKVLDWLDDLVAKVATNTTNIAKNANTITANKKLFDTHTADDNRHWTQEDRQNFDRTIHFKGYFVSIAKLKEAYPTGQLGDYAIVGGSDTVWLWDDETNSWLNSTEQGIVISVNGRTGEVILTKTDVGLSNVDNTSDKNKPISNAQQVALDKKTDRRKISLTESESLSLRSGIYFVSDETKEILGISSNYWTVIIGEQESGTKSATQVWMNYGTGVDPHMYFRHQVSQTSWSEFREVMTNTNFADLQEQINTNKAGIATNKANIEANDKDIATNKANIEKNTEAIATNKANIEANDKDIATNAANIAKNTEEITVNKTAISKNTADIATNKANIAKNTQDIATNKTSISNLGADKADRLKVTVEELDGKTLRAGFYNLYNTPYTIKGYTSNYWSVIVGEKEDSADRRAFQLWVSFQTDDTSGKKIKMFIRRQKFNNTASQYEWEEFVEILTTEHITMEDITRFKQYKGYYETLVDLKTDSPEGNAGDYAVVGDSIYIWVVKSNTWSAISGGGGGSTGTGKWSIRKYDASEYKEQRIPYFKDIVNKTLEGQWEIDDTSDYFINTAVENYKFYLFETYVNMSVATAITSTDLAHDDGIGVYLNDKLVYETKSVHTTAGINSITLNLKKGWNKIQIILFENGGEEKFKLGTQITSNVNCLAMDCYHSDNDLILGYVPLVGDSVIEGNVTIEGKVGVTSNSYLQYNAEDNSISFIFNS